jgi:hypothetical protein
MAGRGEAPPEMPVVEVGEQPEAKAITAAVTTACRDQVHRRLNSPSREGK